MGGCYEGLTLEWSRNVTEATIVIEMWRRLYNEQRWDSNPGYQTPAKFRQAFDSQQARAPLLAALKSLPTLVSLRE